jgi:hypothetical protein
MGGRSLGLDRGACLLGVGRVAQRWSRCRSQAPLDPAPAVSDPRGALDSAVYLAWLCGLVAFALVVLTVDRFLPAGTAVGLFQLAVGAILLVEGLGLVVQRFPFRRLLSARLAPRSHPRSGRFRRTGPPRLLGAALTVLGIVWVGVGVLYVLRGARTLI